MKEPKSQAEAGPFDVFLSAGLTAICRFEWTELARLATQVREDIKVYPSCHLQDDCTCRNLWGQYCHEVDEGPGPFARSWDETLAPHIMARIRELPRPTAVLLTMSAQFDDDEIEGQDGITADEDLLYRKLREAVRCLASDEPEHCEYAVDDEPEGENQAAETIEALLRGRRFEDLTPAERARYGELHSASADDTVAALVNNLNRNVLERHRTQRLSAKLRQADTHPSGLVELELLELGMLAVAFHVEAGRRTFKEVIESLVGDLDLPARQFVRRVPTWYIGVQAVRQGAGQDVTGMEALANVQDIVMAAEHWASDNHVRP